MRNDRRTCRCGAAVPLYSVALRERWWPFLLQLRCCMQSMQSIAAMQLRVLCHWRMQADLLRLCTRSARSHDAWDGIRSSHSKQCCCCHCGALDASVLTFDCCYLPISASRPLRLIVPHLASLAQHSPQQAMSSKPPSAQPKRKLTKKQQEEEDERLAKGQLAGAIAWQRASSQLIVC